MNQQVLPHAGHCDSQNSESCAYFKEKRLIRLRQTAVWLCFIKCNAVMAGGPGGTLTVTHSTFTLLVMGWSQNRGRGEGVFMSLCINQVFKMWHYSVLCILRDNKKENCCKLK